MSTERLPTRTEWEQGESQHTLPLVVIGQGDSQREITPKHLERQGTPWGALSVLWLAFGVLAWLVSLPAKH